MIPYTGSDPLLRGTGGNTPIINDAVWHRALTLSQFGRAWRGFQGTRTEINTQSVGIVILDKSVRQSFQLEDVVLQMSGGSSLSWTTGLHMPTKCPLPG
jgi:hypothetical protein